jgi:hypothetical protein
MENLLSGTYEMSIGNVLIPASLLGDLTPNYDEATAEASTQAGTRTIALGKPSTAELTFTLFLPNIDYLKALWAEAYNAGTGADQTTGNIVFGKGSCETRTPLPINIHNVCEDTDDNDIHIFGAIVKQTFNPTLSANEVLQVECTAYMQPTEDGYIRLGTGDLAHPSHWDATSQSTVAN